MRRLILSVLALACLAAAQLQRFDSTATAVTGQPGSIQLQAVLPGSTVYVCTGTATGATACGTPGTAALFSDIGGTVPLPQPLVADANGEWGFFAASAPLYYTVTPPLSSIGVAYTKNITLGTANAFTFSVPTPAPYAPGSVNVVPVGTTGGTTYYYWVVSDFTIGNSAPSLSAVITNAAGTLSSINYDKVTWTAATGANTYDVLRTTSATAPTGACACAVATAVNALTANDQSNSLNAYTVNTYAGNTTFNITNVAVGAGESKLTFAADHGAQFIVDNINGASFGSLSSSHPSITPTSIEQVLFADQFCATPGTYDQTCINNAILALPGGTWLSQAGTVFVPAHTYALTGPIISHRNVTLDFDPNALLLDNGSANFTSGMIRFCDNVSCSDSPPTTGEAGMLVENPHLRIAQNRTVAFNGYGFGDSTLINLFVDSTSASYATGIGICAQLGASTAGTGGFRNTIINPRCTFDAIGIAAGTLGAGSEPWNSNTIVGGFLQGNPALEIGTGSGNSILGTQVNGSNSNGDQIVKMDAGSSANTLEIPYVDDGLGGGNTGTAFVVASGATGNIIRGYHLDAEGGTLNSGTASDAGTATTWLPPSGNGDTVVGGSGNMFFSQACGSGQHIDFGTTTASSYCYGFNDPQLNGGIETWNMHTASASASTAWSAFFQNSTGDKKLFGALVFEATNITAGSEQSRGEIDTDKNGVQISAFGCTAGDCGIHDSLTINGGSQLTTTNQTGTGNIVMSASPTLTGTTTANVINATTLEQGGVPLLFSGSVTITASSTALAAVTGTVSITGVTTGMACVASAAGTRDPDAFPSHCWVSAAGTVTVEVTTRVTDASPGAIVYEIRVIQ